MRPGIVFLVLFAALIGLYLLLADTLGVVPTFFLQAGIVLMIVGAARWLRRARQQRERRGLSGDGTVAEPQATDEDHEVPKAG